MNFQKDHQRSGERLFSLTEGEAIVHRDKSGKVSPNWLCACEQERILTKRIMDQVADPLNLQKAYRRVKANNGKGGVDGMEVNDLGRWLRENLNTLRRELMEGIYAPSAVRGVKIPKPQGGYRQLGIPTVKDRLVQQAIQQVLNKRYEKISSERSYGFRPNRSAHNALAQAGVYVRSGKVWVVDLDLEKFFDEVNHHRLMWLLSTRIGDERLLQLIHRFVKSGIMEGGLISQRIKGTPQGGPLSPLLSNIVLDELDKEMERRGYSYVRYADDVKIFVNHEEKAIRTLSSISDFIASRLRLKVNRKKSRICRSIDLDFLGHNIYPSGQPGLSLNSEARMKKRIKGITSRNRGVSLKQVLHDLQHYLRGWLEYFKGAKMLKKMERIDRWLRRKLRCYRLKQCKRAIGIVRWLRGLGVEQTLCWRTALSGKSWWRLSNSPALSIGATNQWFHSQGYYSVHDQYRALHRTLL